MTADPQSSPTQAKDEDDSSHHAMAATSRRPTTRLAFEAPSAPATELVAASSSSSSTIQSGLASAAARLFPTPPPLPPRKPTPTIPTGGSGVASAARDATVATNPSLPFTDTDTDTPAMPVSGDVGREHAMIQEEKVRASSDETSAAVAAAASSTISPESVLLPVDRTDSSMVAKDSSAAAAPPPPLPPRNLATTTSATTTTADKRIAVPPHSNLVEQIPSSGSSPSPRDTPTVPGSSSSSGPTIALTQAPQQSQQAPPVPVTTEVTGTAVSQPPSATSASDLLDTVATGLGFGSATAQSTLPTTTTTKAATTGKGLADPETSASNVAKRSQSPREEDVGAVTSNRIPDETTARQTSHYENATLPSETPNADSPSPSTLSIHLPRIRTLLLVVPLLLLARILPHNSSFGSSTLLALCLGALWLDGQFERSGRERKAKQEMEMQQKGRQGNARHGKHFTESVEWMNHALRAMFPVLSTDLLIPFIDLLEDAMMTQMPTALVSSVRLTTPSLGEEPIRIQAIRPMTDAEWFAQLSTAPSAPADAASKQGKDRDEPKDTGHSGDGRGHLRQRSSTSMTSQTDSSHRADEAVTRRKRDRILRRIAGRRGHGVGMDEDDDRGKFASDDFLESTAVRDTQTDLDEGQYVNYAVDFSFDGTRNPSDRTLHFLAFIGAGLKGLVGGEIPIWIELLKVTGTVHIRLLLSPSIPFIRTGTVSLPSVPDFDFTAKPIKDISLDFMSLPFVKPYIARSIRDVADAFVRPKSYTMDLDRLLLGHEGSLRTAAVGVLHLRLHGASNLAKSDSFGSSDPYCVVSLSKYAKPLFSTRTIVDSLNPRWEEDAYILIPADAIESGERLLLTIYDSDRYSSDDDLGLIELDLAELLDLNENQLRRHEMRRRIDDLSASRRGMRAEGQIEWSWEFAPLWQQPKDDKPSESQPDKKANSPQGLLESLIEKIKPEPFPWQEEHERRRRNSLSWLSGDRAREALEAAGKPSLDRRSGVLQFTITQCQALEMRPSRGTFSSKRTAGVSGGKPALEEVIDSAAWESPKPPSPYCEVILNGRLVFRTRTKQLSPAPYWNAVSERFVRDWSKARIVFVVRDERDRERDPVIGLAAFHLADIFHSASQVTRTFPLMAGLGWGTIRLSLLFKAIDMELPRGISGYEICSIKTKRFETTAQADDIRVVSDVDEGGIDRELAVEYRHSCSLLYRFMEKNGRLKSDTCIGMAVVRLSEVPDNEDWECTVPIYPTSDLNEACERAQKRLDVMRDGGSDPDATLPQLHLGLFLHAGVSEAHRKLAKRDRRMQHVYEAWQLAQDVGTRADYTSERARRAAIQRARDGRSDQEDGIDDADDAGQPLSAQSSSMTSPRSAGDSNYEYDETTTTSSPGGGGERSSRSRRSSGASGPSATSNGSRWREWREHSKALHRHHQGVMSNKLARSIAQGKDKVQEAMQRARSKGKGTHRGRGADVEVEVEGISKL